MRQEEQKDKAAVQPVSPHASKPGEAPFAKNSMEVGSLLLENLKKQISQGPLASTMMGAGANSSGNQIIIPGKDSEVVSQIKNNI